MDKLKNAYVRTWDKWIPNLGRRTNMRLNFFFSDEKKADIWYEPNTKEILRPLMEFHSVVTNFPIRLSRQVNGSKGNFVSCVLVIFNSVFLMRLQSQGRFTARIL